MSVVLKLLKDVSIMHYADDTTCIAENATEIKTNKHRKMGLNIRNTKLITGTTTTLKTDNLI